MSTKHKGRTGSTPAIPDKELTAPTPRKEDGDEEESGDDDSAQSPAKGIFKTTESEDSEGTEDDKDDV